MATFLVVPPDLTPTELAYQDDLPPIVTALVQESSAHRRQGEALSAIECAQLAQELAEADRDVVSTIVIILILADVHRELDQLGPAQEYCRQVHRALRLKPNYEHRYHTEAVVSYLEGLIYHALGAYTRALSRYQRAIMSFGEAARHWRSIADEYPMQSPERQKAEKWVATCGKATQWVRVLCRCLAGALTPATRAGTEMHIPAANGEEYDLARLELRTCLPPAAISIDRQRYRMYHPDNGYPFQGLTLIEPNVSFFVVYVPEDRWAGPHSRQGDYVLAQRKRTVDEPQGVGLLRQGDRQTWTYGRLKYSQETKRLWFYPGHLIGQRGGPADQEREREEVTHQEIGVVRALLKPE